MNQENSFSHFNERGEAQMVDVHEKPLTHRQATAVAMIRMLPDTLSWICHQAIAKGDVLATARIADRKSVV